MIQILDKLANGYTVVAAEMIAGEHDPEEWVVLATNGREYVTWRATGLGDTFWGHYYADIERAAADFKKRIG